LAANSSRFSVFFDIDFDFAGVDIPVDLDIHPGCFDVEHALFALAARRAECREASEQD
jgi:hypothetical protein